MFRKCFSQPNTPRSSPNSHQVPQNLITSIYQAQIFNTPTYLTLTWSRSIFSHSLTVYSTDSFCITISLYPSTFSFFRDRGQGSKSIYLRYHHCNQRLKLHWDFSKAEFASNSAEPERCFYLAISCNSRLGFFLGDLHNDLTRRSGLARRMEEPNLLSRREHAFGQKIYVSRAKFLGCRHEIGIECNGGTLVVKVDGATSLVVKRLAWKFRGNERILVGETEVEFYWDVFNWVNGKKKAGGDHIAGSTNGVFIFHVGDNHGGVWPEMVGPEKRLMRKSLSSSASTPPRGGVVLLSPSPSCSSVLQWAEESSDCGRRSCSSSTTRSSGSSGGFSLLLYAWRKDGKFDMLGAE